MLNFVHIGIGQCGNRFAEQFGKNGRIALAVNTARIDMSQLNNKVINARNQIHIAMPDSPDGAGRDPEIGRESMEANLEKVYGAIQRATSDINVDRFVIWAGLGGGTGTGGVIPLMKYLINKGHNVMLGLTIPRKKEGWVVRMNALKALTNITDAMNADKRNVVPFLVIDNERFSGNVSSNNEIIVKNLIRFTKTTNNVPSESAFDDRDFNRLLNYRGIVTVVRTCLQTETLKGDDSFAKAVQESWKKSVYASFDYESATGAANLVIVPSRFYKTKGNNILIDENIEGIEELYPHANPYSCIYETNNEDIDKKIIIYTLLTGLPNPDENLDEMYEDISEQISEDKERRKKRSRAEKESRAKRRVIEYDPNADYDDDDDNEEEDKNSYEKHSKVLI